MVASRSKRPSHTVREWCTRFEDRCRERAIRVTAQRLAVYRILAEETTHPTAETVYARLRPAMTWLSLATVYRILESLEREGFIRRVSTTGAVARFDANIAPHQHLVCRSCGRMTDFEEEALSQLDLPRKLPPEFVAEELDIRIIGICATCRPLDG